MEQNNETSLQNRVFVRNGKRPFALLVVACFAIALTAEGLCAAPIDVGNRLQVLWDDYLVDLPKTTAVLTPHQAEYVDTVMTFDKKWEGDNCNYKTLVEDVDEKGKLYRMYYLAWYSGNAKPGAPTYAPGRRVCCIESRDGVHWTRPSLGICSFEGSRDNNIIADADTIGIGGKPVELWDCFIVAKDPRPDCPPAERYKATGLTLQRDKKTGRWIVPGLACWISSDGLHFTYGWKHEGLTGIIGDSMNVTFWDPKRKIWHFYGRGSHKATGDMDREGLDGVRDVRYSWSKDCRKWEIVPKRLDFGPDAEDYGLYTNQIEPYFRNPDILIGFPSRYVERLKWNDSFERLCGVEARRARGGKDHACRLGRAITDCIFMFSRDGGAKFTRCDEAFMRPGPEYGRNWVYGSCYPAYHVVLSPGRRGDAPVLTWYTEVGHFSGAAAELDRYCLRMDGFFSYRAKYGRAHPSTLVTKPIVFSGDTFTMNFSTSARGGVYVTIRGEDGRSIRSCEQFGDSTDRVVDFQGGRVADFAGKPVTIRFDMSDADIYSFRFGNGK